jgi:hypothetical protein
MVAKRHSAETHSNSSNSPSRGGRRFMAPFGRLFFCSFRPRDAQIVDIAGLKSMSNVNVLELGTASESIPRTLFPSRFSFTGTLNTSDLAERINLSARRLSRCKDNVPLKVLFHGDSEQ